MKIVEFGTLFQFIRNGMNVQQDKSGSGLPITRIETISDAIVEPSRFGYAGLQEDDCTDWLMQPGDILFSHINSIEHIGKCAVYRGVPEKLVHGMNLLCLRCDTAKLLPEFAKYMIRSMAFRTRLANFINKAVNQASVSIGNLKTIPVWLPTLTEQRRIAEMLDRAEALRVKRRTALAKFNPLTQALFFDLFGDPITNPKAWPTCDLGGIAREKPNNGIFRKNPEYSSAPTEGLPVVWVEELFRGNSIDTVGSRRLNASAAEVERYGLRYGDVLFCRSSLKLDGIAFNNVYLGAEKAALFECHLIRLSPRLDVVSPVFLNTLLRLPQLRSVAKSKSKTATMTTIDQQSLCSIPIVVPPLALQREFARRVSVVEKLEAAHRASLAEMDAVFAALQHRAFRGEL